MNMLHRIFRRRTSIPLPQIAGGGTFVPTHQHRKGGMYRLLAKGIAEAERKPVAIYDDAEGTIWVRALEEFEDGRFRPLQT